MRLSFNHYLITHDISRLQHHASMHNIILICLCRAWSSHIYRIDPVQEWCSFPSSQYEFLSACRRSHHITMYRHHLWIAGNRGIHDLSLRLVVQVNSSSLYRLTWYYNVVVLWRWGLAACACVIHLYRALLHVRVWKSRDMHCIGYSDHWHRQYNDQFFVDSSVKYARPPYTSHMIVNRGYSWNLEQTWKWQQNKHWLGYRTRGYQRVRDVTRQGLQRLGDNTSYETAQGIFKEEFDNVWYKHLSCGTAANIFLF